MAAPVRSNEANAPRTAPCRPAGADRLVCVPAGAPGAIRAPARRHEAARAACEGLTADTACSVTRGDQTKTGPASPGEPTPWSASRTTAAPATRRVAPGARQPEPRAPTKRRTPHARWSCRRGPSRGPVRPRPPATSWLADPPASRDAAACAAITTDAEGATDRPPRRSRSARTRRRGPSARSPSRPRPSRAPAANGVTRWCASRSTGAVGPVTATGDATAEPRR